VSLAHPDRDRRLLPRWQTSTVAIAAGELASSRRSEPEAIGDEHFESRKQEWETERSLEVAAELVGSGIVLGRTGEVESAARLILDAHSDASPSLREMAAVALGEKPKRSNRLRSQTRGRIDRSQVHQTISQLKYSLTRQPRNVLSWVDLARLYAILGQTSQSERAIRTALLLGPNDRFTLRCSARFFVHIDDPERALALLQRAGATKSDPWLMSAEIAVAQVTHRPSKSISIASKALKQATWSAHSQSELQGSVATALLYDGAVIKARRMFQESLENPTENVVAQAQWASSRTSGIVIPQKALTIPHNFEANALRGRMLGQWAHVLEDCWSWADYEQTSTRPTTLGSYIAGVVFGDAEAMLEFAERGAVVDPKNAMIHNNLAVAFAHLGRLKEAWSAFERIVIEHESTSNRSVLLATLGLLLFRSGDEVEGRRLYDQALDQTPQREIKALVLWHLAQEEIFAKSVEIQRAIARAETGSKGIELPELHKLRDRVRKMA
jgi:tetratricopeptide (TPR) repeat protein